MHHASFTGLKIERARVPGARSLAVGHAAFASCVPGVHATCTLRFSDFPHMSFFKEFQPLFQPVILVEFGLFICSGIIAIKLNQPTAPPNLTDIMGVNQMNSGIKFIPPAN